MRPTQPSSRSFVEPAQSPCNRTLMDTVHRRLPRLDALFPLAKHPVWTEVTRAWGQWPQRTRGCWWPVLLSRPCGTPLRQLLISWLRDTLGEVPFQLAWCWGALWDLTGGNSCNRSAVVVGIKGKFSHTKSRICL